MSNAFVQQKTEQSTSSVSSFTTSSMTVTAGNTLVVASSANQSGVGINLAITDSAGDAFSTATICEAVGGQRVQIDVATGIAGGSITVTVTITGATGFLSIAVQEYSGATAAVQTIGNVGGIDHTPSCGTLDPPSAGDLYVMACTHNGTGNETFTAGGSWTRRSNLTLTANQPLGTEDLIASGLQTGSGTYGGAGSLTWNATGCAIRAGDVGSPDPGLQFIGVDFPRSDRGF